MEKQLQLRKTRQSTSSTFSNYQKKRIPVEENSFPFVFIDLTYRCNMSCNVCYNPVRPMPDISLSYLQEAIPKLPNPIELRMLGGEPTLHKDFFEICKLCFDYGHSIYISTNGKTFARSPEFIKRLKSLYQQRPRKESKIKIHLDMSGGLQPDLYQKIHNDSTALQDKLKCLEAFDQFKLGRVTISSILVRGLNESVIEDLFVIAENNKRIVREVAFRSQGPIGRYISGEEHSRPYKTNEWLLLMQEKNFLQKQHLSKVIHAGFLESRCEGRNCCYQFRYNNFLNVSFLEFLNQGCWQRGQLLENEFAIEYMFESLVANDSNKLGEDFAEEDINRAILKDYKGVGKS